MEKAIEFILKSKIKSRNDLMLAKRKAARLFGVGLVDNSELSRYYQKKIEAGLCRPDYELLSLLKKRSIRTMSGIAPVAVLTKPYPCPGNCAFCPTEKDVPQSYLSNEPAVMRAIRCGYNPYVQVQDRLRALIANGHEPTKIELIVIGGTWSYLPARYKLWYIASLFAAANQFSIKNEKLKIKNYYNFSLSFSALKEALLKEQKNNEKARYNIIGLTLETRPDYIDEKELWEMRVFGCTRVELGVQAIDDKILTLNNRGHDVECVAKATKLLKDFGFKVTYHLMPGLPGATSAKDKKIYKQLFTDERFQPDQVKFYPTVVTKGSLLHEWWLAGKYKPYSDKVLKDLIIECKKNTPEYVRIIRLIRDIPGESIEAGNKITNLRQVLQQEGVFCRCLRCREPHENKLGGQKLNLKIIEYQASGGREFFISYNSIDDKIVYGFCRLRLIGGETAIIRELHVYGELVAIGGQKKVQHAGLGKKLIKQAERIAKKNNYARMKIISGVGVRGYYRKRGYKLKNTYMEKAI
jgi:elongator complex protein 3